MKILPLLPIFAITSLAACSHHENYRSASEAAAITASDVQNAHLEATTTLDRIADETASDSIIPSTAVNSSRPASIPQPPN